METPKLRTGSLVSANKPSPGTPRTAQKLKTSGLNSSPKVLLDLRSPKSLSAEKKKPGRVSQLETQIFKLQEELGSSEASKRKAQNEEEEAKKQLSAASEKLLETEKQLRDVCESEVARVRELRQLSHERDKAWKSELEAMEKQHSMDSAAFVSAMNEIQRLKIQLERVSESAYAENQNLRFELTETLALVDKLKEQLNESRESEAKACEEVVRAQTELQVLKTTEDELRLESVSAKELFDSLQHEFELSKNRVSSLEELVENLKAELSTCNEPIDGDVSSESQQSSFAESESLRTELDTMKREANELRAALEAAEMSYRDEYIQSTLEIRNAYELAEHAKSRESELEAKLKESMAQVEDLAKKLIDRENTENNAALAETERELELKLKESESVLENVKASLREKETQIQIIEQENTVLKSEISKKDSEQKKEHDQARGLAESAKASELETLAKLGKLTEEAEKSSNKAARLSDELFAAQEANCELEAELRRLKVQSDQWRKAAEAAASMLCNNDGNNNAFERSMSSDYRAIIGGKLSSPISDDMDDGSPKKKNGNVLKIIGGLLKKGQK